MDKKHVIFDMDGMLLDSMQYWRRLTRDYLDLHGHTWSEEMDRIADAHTMMETAELFKQKLELEATVDDILEYCYKRMAHYYEQDVTIKEGVVPYLDYLRSKNVRMSVATATDGRLARPAIERLGLTPYFDRVLSCADVGQSKEHPTIYLELARDWDLPAEEVAVFEDAPYALKTAAAAGFYTVLMYDEFYAQEQKEVADLANEVHKRMDALIQKEGHE